MKTVKEFLHQSDDGGPDQSMIEDEGNRSAPVVRSAASDADLLRLPLQLLERQVSDVVVHLRCQVSPELPWSWRCVRLHNSSP